MKNVMVTGATGLLGNNIVRELLDQGHQVTVAVRPSSKREPFAGLDLKVVEVDFNDSASISRAIAGVDTVIHSAGFIWFGWSKLRESMDVNLGITSRIAKLCLEKDIRLVHVSSVDALPVGEKKGDVLDEESVGKDKVPCNYVVSKRAADMAILEMVPQGLNASIVHPSLMFGPWDWKPSSAELIQAISKMGFWFACPTGGISVADVRDVARGTIAAGEKGKAGRKYILAGRNIPYRELCGLIAEKIKVWRPVNRAGIVAYYLAAGYSGLTKWWRGESIVNTAALQMSWDWHYYSSQRAETELGYHNRDLDETLNDTVAWLVDQNMIEIKKK